MKKYIYLLLIAMVLAFLVLFGEMYNFIPNTSIKVIMIAVALLCLVGYLIIKYKNKKRK